MRTTTQHLADLILGIPVERWIATQRASGCSYRLIARELEAETSGRVVVTTRTLRNWMAAQNVAA
jgi:hypothetical protein